MARADTSQLRSEYGGGALLWLFHNELAVETGSLSAAALRDASVCIVVAPAVILALDNTHTHTHTHTHTGNPARRCKDLPAFCSILFVCLCVVVLSWHRFALMR